MHEIAESELQTVSGLLFWIPMMSGILKSWRSKLTLPPNVPNIFSISLMKYGFAMESGSILNSVTKNAKDGSFSPV